MFQIALVAFAARKLGSARILGTMRAAAYGGVVVAVVGVVGMHKARAAVVQDGLHFGEDLAAVAPMLKGATTMNVNGQRVHFGTSTSLEGVKGVLDKFEASCQAGEGGDAPVWNSIAADPEQMRQQMKGKTTLDKFPVFRSEEGPRGFVACLVPTAQQTQSGFQASIKNFLEKHTSLQLGKLRYANVHETPTGTSVMTVWTDENFDLAAFVPDADKDKPGVDPSVMLRPASSVRMLSGLVEAMPYKVFLYESKQSPKEAIDAYDTTMFAQGWVSIQVPQMAGAPHEGFEAHSYMRDGFIGYVTTSTGPTGSTLVGVGETASPTLDNKTLAAPKDSDGF